jgi:CrcB protein
MKHLLAIACAGALGALCRYGMVNLVGGRTFPWGTLAVNALGALIMGILFVVIVERAVVDASFKPILMTGFLGAFTTFSAFSLESWELLDRGEPFLALVYMIGSVLLSLLALTFGIYLARASL